MKRIAGKDEATGAFKLAIREEEFEILDQLYNSIGWKTYRDILMNIKDGHLHESMGICEPYRLKQQVSIAAGINLAINQLGVLIAQKQKLDAKKHQKLIDEELDQLLKAV